MENGLLLTLLFLALVSCNDDDMMLEDTIEFELDGEAVTLDSDTKVYLYNDLSLLIESNSLTIYIDDIWASATTFNQSSYSYAECIHHTYLAHYHTDVSVESNGEFIVTAFDAGNSEISADFSFDVFHMNILSEIRVRNGKMNKVKFTRIEEDYCPSRIEAIIDNEMVKFLKVGVGSDTLDNMERINVSSLHGNLNHFTFQLREDLALGQHIITEQNLADFKFMFTPFQGDAGQEPIDYPLENAMLQLDELDFVQKRARGNFSGK